MKRKKMAELKNVEKKNVETNVKPDGKTEKKVIVEFQEIKQKQTVLDLDSNEDAEITVVTKRIVWAKDATTEMKLSALHKLVTPAEKQIDALQKFYEGESYRESKEKALGAGNFLTPQLRSGISQFMSGIQAYSELSAKECFNRWLDGYKAKKPSAIKILNTVKAAQASEEFSDL